MLTRLLGALWASSMVLAAAGAAQGADCRLLKVAELPIRFSHNRPMMPVTLNGHESWFLVDTGAADTIMWGGAARALNLRFFTVDNMNYYGVGGGQQASAVLVSDFGLGGAKLKDIKFYVIGRTGTAENSGILGRDFFQAWDLEFDLANKTLRLWQPQNCGQHSLAYWTKDPEAVDMMHDTPTDEYRLNVMVNGKPISAILDSGATTTVITPDAAFYAGIPNSAYDKRVGHASGVGDEQVEVRIADVDDVKVGVEDIKHTKLEVADLWGKTTRQETGHLIAQHVDMGNTSMLLGADFLRSHRVLIAPSQKLIYFTYSGGQIFEAVGDPIAAKGAPPAPPPATTPPPTGQ